SRIVVFWAPGLVGTPPSAMVISFPWGVRAVSTETSRDQPPLAAIDVCTDGAPKISTGVRNGADVRTALPLRANVVTPGNETVVGATGGSVAPRRATWPPNFSDATYTDACAPSQPVLRR